MIPRFRAWDTTNKEMFKDTFAITESGQVVVVDQSSVFVSPDYVFVDNLVIMQSTGLKDKNDKEIFEGDIVKRYKSPFFKAKWEYQIETVIKEKASLLLGRKFGKNFGTIPFDSPFAKSELLEVIGSIYKNPELLEDKE